MGNYDDTSLDKYSLSFNKVVDVFSPFYKKPFFADYSIIPAFEDLELNTDPILVFDLTMMNCTYVNKSTELLDLDIKKILRKSFSYTLNLLLENERQIVITEIFPILFKYAEFYMKKNQLSDFKASFCSHVRLKNGEYGWFLQEISILGTDPKTGHVIGLEQFIDINYVKKDNLIDLFILIKDENGIYRAVEKKSFNS